MDWDFSDLFHWHWYMPECSYLFVFTMCLNGKAFYSLFILFYCFYSLGDAGYDLEIGVVLSSSVHEFFWVWVSYIYFFASFSFRSSCRKNGGRDLCCFISHIHQVLVYCGVCSIVCLFSFGVYRNEIHE